MKIRIRPDTPAQDAIDALLGPFTREQLLDLSRRVLTEQVHDAAGADGAASRGSEPTPQDSKRDDA
jgi:hypothetical protein